MTRQDPRRHVGRTIRKEIRIAASPMQVWEAWADPKKIAQWFVDRAEGEAKAGGTMMWHFDAFDLHMPIPVAEAEPGQSFVIAGEIPGRPPFLQEVLIRQEGGTTRLQLFNSGFLDDASWDDEYEGVDSGWSMALRVLKLWLESYPGQPRTHHFTMRPARFDYATTNRLFGTSAGLGRWLADEARIAGPFAEGTDVHLRLKGGGALDGSVLCATPREYLLAWPERRGSLSLKAFPAPPQGRAVGLDFNAWGLDPAAARQVRSQLDTAVARLSDALQDPTTA